MLSDDHPATLSSAENPATDITTLSEHEQPHHLHDQILTHHRHLLSDDHPDTLRSAHNRGVTCACSQTTTGLTVTHLD